MKSVFEIILCFAIAFAVVESHAEQREGKAVFETSPELGMKLSDIALKNIEVETRKLSSADQLTVSKKTLVFFQDKIGIYRRRDGWFKLIEVKVLKRQPDNSIVKSTELKAGDEIVVSGADLLRVAEMDAFGGEE